jgi:hypothetical protein
VGWLSKHKVCIDYAKMSVKLTVGWEGIGYITELVVTTKGVVTRVKLNQLDASQGPEVPVVNEFSNVFLEKLLVMPPDRNIEFVIE